MKLAMYKGRGKIGNSIIRWWTKSKYSHCEIVIDGYCYSSSLMDGGTRKKMITLDSSKWDLIDLSEFSQSRVLEYFAKTEGNKYGWLDLLVNQLFNKSDNRSKSEFCSEWVSAALGIPDPVIYSPKTLNNLVQWLELRGGG